MRVGARARSRARGQGRGFELELGFVLTHLIHVRGHSWVLSHRLALHALHPKDNSERDGRDSVRHPKGTRRGELVGGGGRWGEGAVRLARTHVAIRASDGQWWTATRTTTCWRIKFMYERTMRRGGFSSMAGSQKSW